MTERQSEPLFNRYPKRHLSVDFDGGSLTSDGGLLLIRQAGETLGFTEGLASCIRDWRSPLLITHTLTDQVRQRTYQICAGYEDADDCESKKNVMSDNGRVRRVRLIRVIG